MCQALHQPRPPDVLCSRESSQTRPCLPPRQTRGSSGKHLWGAVHAWPLGPRLLARCGTWQDSDKMPRDPFYFYLSKRVPTIAVFQEAQGMLSTSLQRRCFAHRAVDPGRRHAPPEEATADTMGGGMTATFPGGVGGGQVPVSLHPLWFCDVHMVQGLHFSQVWAWAREPALQASGGRGPCSAQPFAPGPLQEVPRFSEPQYPHLKKG